MFTRTKLGLENEHLFHNVEFVVYCEGKLVEGEGSSLDEVFWERVFSELGKSVHCKSMGGKSVVIPLARRICEEGLSNIVVAMDRDYDDFQGSMIDHPQVFYTFGYSWESDVMQHFQFGSALSLFATTVRSNSFQDEFMNFLEGSSCKLRRLCALDFKYFGHAGKLFDRQRPMSIIATPGTENLSSKLFRC